VAIYKKNANQRQEKKRYKINHDSNNPTRMSKLQNNSMNRGLFAVKISQSNFLLFSKNSTIFVMLYISFDHNLIYYATLQ